MPPTGGIASIPASAAEAAQGEPQHRRCDMLAINNHPVECAGVSNAAAVGPGSRLARTC
jgi:hypothetical protein